MPDTSLEKRTWCYRQAPAAFEIAPCSCGNNHTQWSEFVGHLGCDACQKDFIPAHRGIFDGPIPVKLTAVMGISFDRIDLVTGALIKFDIETGEFIEMEETS